MQTRKICILGDFAVGKTSLVRRYVHQQFSENYLTTIGVKVDTKIIAMADGPSLKLVIWDVAGTDTPTELFLRYVRGAQGYLLVADGTRPETLSCCLELRDAVAAQVRPIPYVGLINKSDLLDQQAITDPMVEHACPGMDDWLHTSAKTGEHVDLAFERLARRLLEDA